MGTRIATARASGERVTERLIEGLRSQLGDAAPSWVMTFTSEGKLEELIPGLADAFAGASVMGATTAGEFTENGDTVGGSVAWAVSGDISVRAHMVKGLRENLEGALDELVAAVGSDSPTSRHRTAFVFLDPLSGNAEEATLLLSMRLGQDIPLVGGASADRMLMEKTMVGLGRQAASDAIVLAVVESDRKLGIGVAHGHTPLSSPLTITRSEGNVVHELEGRPAWDVWVEQTRERCRALGIQTADLSTSEEIFQFLNRFEAGLRITEHDYKVRVPLSRTPEGGLQFACGMPTGAVIVVMESVEANQIESADRAVRLALESLGHTDVAGAIMFDCSCRKSILCDRFGEAVLAMRKALGEGAPFAGFETYGEIALQVGDYSGFHNTTTVAVTLPR